MPEDMSEFENVENTIAQLIVSVNATLLNFWNVVNLNHEPLSCWVYLTVHTTVTKDGSDEYLHEQRFAWYEDGGYDYDIITRILDVVETFLTTYESVMALSSFTTLVSVRSLTRMVIPYEDD